MIISIISVMDKARGIGKANKLPWNVPADLNFFRKKTLGKPVIMGWNTFVSIGSKPLSERFNIVISNRKDVCIPKDVYLADDAASALLIAKDTLLRIDSEINEDDEIMIIGGAKIYDSFVHYADRMYLTFLDCKANCDTFFPKFDESIWKGFMIESGISNKIPYEIYQFDVSE